MTQMELVTLDLSSLTSWYNSKINLSLASTYASSTSSASATDEASETSDSDLPWRVETDQDALLIKALGASSFISDSVATAARAASGDEEKIIAAYEALQLLTSIAQAAVDETLPAGQEDRAEKRLLEGIAEVKSFLASVDIEKSILIAGDRISSAQSEVAIQRSTYEYSTKVLHEGEYDAEVEAFTGDKVFTVSAKKVNTTIDVTIDLSEMEATTGKTVRNLDNVAEFINFKLEEAGIQSRFERQKIGVEDEDGVIEGDSFGFLISGTSTEQLSFSATDTQTAAIMVGQSGLGDNGGGQISIWTGLDTGTVERAAAARLADEVDSDDDSDEPKETTINATAAHPDGGYVVVGTTAGSIGDGEVRGEDDAFMARYDSQGQLVWSRTLGAASSAEGLAIAVSDDGMIAITGKTSDDLITNAIGGGEDTFVTMYDEDGIEQWTRQRAANYDDQGNTIAFASDGSLVIGGTTASTLTEGALAGGKDAFIEKLDAEGNQLWIRQFGTAENDSVQEVKVADDGSVIVASIENGEAVIRRYASDVDDTGDWSYSLGNLNGGTIGALEIADDGTVFVGGSTRTTGEDANGFTTGTQSDRDGFVASFDVSGGTPSLNWMTRLGGEGYQDVEGIQVTNGNVIVAGTGEGVFGTGTSDKDQSAFLSQLDVTDGTQGWSTSLSGRGGVSSATDLVLSDTYSDTLDAFGLPDGDMVLADTANITDRLSLRPGDNFYVSVDGGRDKKITIEQGDNLRTLTFKLNAALVLDGTADIRRSNGAQSLVISPADGVQIELKAGDSGQDALAALGLSTSVIMENPVTSSDSSINDGPEIVTLGLLDTLSFDDEESRTEALEVLEGALRGLRTAYRWAIDDPTLTALKESSNSPGKNADGTPPAYLTAQIANLQAGLTRLTGGSSSSTLSLFA
ncbi:MAG: hypothetical protein CMK05_08685 [Ponticaulis sp.]|nr:hypothetical protein [Ponticaulis sp.]|tara:strand:+ start:172580 stop:175321 length:2742 start_codon:yes stop_codon:yes gene_type:complete